MTLSFNDIMKAEPSVADVHVATALGNERPRRRKKPKITTEKRYASVADLPAAVRGKLKGKRRRQWMRVWNSVYDAHPDLPANERESRAFVGAWSAVKKVLLPVEGLRNRRLEPLDEHAYHAPFPRTPGALGLLREEQVPRFLDALTHPGRLDEREVPLASLRAIQDRVGIDVTRKHLRRLAGGRPPRPALVLRFAGADHVANGHERLAAAWLNGDDLGRARYLDLDAEPGPVSTAARPRGSRFDLLKPKNGRRLHWNADGTLASPLVHDPRFLSGLREDQVQPFLGALINAGKLPIAKLSIASIYGLRDRIDSDRVAARVERPSDEPALVVRLHGRDYLADGHCRVAARWLAGADEVEVHLCDLGTLTKVAPAWEVPLEVRKVDPDQQMIFGWASVVTKDGKPIVDKQGDIIPVDELERAFYHYVLFSRNQGHMHTKTGVGRLIECMVFTAEKQKALGIDLGMEGAWVGFLVDDPEVWAAHKRGELPELSIGGFSVPVEMEMD